VFEYDGLFYIIDYKSNYLGPRAEDYCKANIEAVMASHHYYLQYLIYTVALNRYLAIRVSGYDYDLHFGGVYYLFLRGIQEATSHGLFFHRPEQTLVKALDTCFDGLGPRVSATSVSRDQLSLPGISQDDDSVEKQGPNRR
jgi:exodeoxyribonuclease V beta subunit